MMMASFLKRTLASCKQILNEIQSLLDRTMEQQREHDAQIGILLNRQSCKPEDQTGTDYKEIRLLLAETQREQAARRLEDGGRREAHPREEVRGAQEATRARMPRGPGGGARRDSKAKGPDDKGQDGLGWGGGPRKGSQDLITKHLDVLDGEDEMLLNNEMMFDVKRDLNPDMWKRAVHLRQQRQQGKLARRVPEGVGTGATLGAESRGKLAVF